MPPTDVNQALNGYYENGGPIGVGVWGRGEGSVRVDVNEELKFCENAKKKSGGGVVGGVREDLKN